MLRDCDFGCMGLWHLTSYCDNYMNTRRVENEWSCDGMEIRHKHSLSELVMQKCVLLQCVFFYKYIHNYKMCTLLQSVHNLLKNLQIQFFFSF